MIANENETLCSRLEQSIITNGILQSKIELETTNNRHANLSYLKGDTTEPLNYQTIGQCTETAAGRYSTKVAIAFHKGASLTYSQVLEQTEKLAAAFIALGLQQGDHLAIWGFNSIEWYLAFLASVKCGLVAVNLNPLYEGPELLSCLTKADVKAIVMDEQLKSHHFYEILKNAVPEVCDFEYKSKISSARAPLLQSIVIISEKSYRGTFRWKDLFSMYTPDHIKHLKKRESEIDVFDACNIQFTSGTTNTPKAVLLTHFGIVNNAYFTGKYLDLNQHEKSCIPVPFFHTYGTVASIMANIQHGSTIVVPAVKFSPNKTIDCIIDEKCTLMYGTPTMYIDLINVLNKRSVADPQIFSKLSSLKRFFSGGALCLPELIRKLKRHFEAVEFSSGYGMTEILSPFMTLAEESSEKILTVVGRIMDHHEVKLVNSLGDTVPLGEAGELCCKGYSVMKGYYSNPEKTNAALTEDGWFHTGDRFVFLKNGYAQIIGRIKETIIRGGENIEPKEIEDLLSKHPDVINIQVYGISCDRLGEVVGASIIKKDNSNLTADGVKKYCHGLIASYKIPQHIFFEEDFPKTASGKVQKFKLKEAAERKLSKRNE